MFVNLAHRGASAYLPENTVEAFCLGLWMGAGGIETDVRRASDGTLVLFHDDELKRMAGRPGSVGDYTYRELHDMDVLLEGCPDVGRIVRFEDFARYFGHKNIVFQIELKAEDIERDVVEVMRGYGMAEKSFVSSFDAEKLEKVKSFAPDVRTCLLCGTYDEDTEALISKIKADCVSLRAGGMTAQTVESAVKDGLRVHAWGVKNTEDMRRALDCGVQGMTVNFPDVLANELKIRGEDASNG